MFEKRLESLESLHSQRLKEYQDYKQAESLHKAKASVRIQQVKDILKTIPQNIQVRLDLVPEKDIEEMSYEELTSYGEKVEKSFNYIADKIQAYLTSGDISHLNGIEEAVGVALNQQPVSEDTITIPKPNPTNPEIHIDGVPLQEPDNVISSEPSVLTSNPNDDPFAITETFQVGDTNGNS